MAPDIIERLKASALSSALTIYPCQIRVQQRWQSKLQLPTGRRSGGRPQPTVYPRRLSVNTVIHTTLAGIEPTTFRLLVRRATSSAANSPVQYPSVATPFRDGSINILFFVPS